MLTDASHVTSLQTVQPQSLSPDSVRVRVIIMHDCHTGFLVHWVLPTSDFI